MLLSNLWFYVKYNKLQVLLCSLSMAIAVVCMHLIGSMSYLLKEELMNQVSLMGTDLLMGYVYENCDTKYLEDMQTSGLIDQYSLIRSDVSMDMSIKYVQPSYFDLYKMHCVEGRLFTIYDQNVVVLGCDVKGYKVGDVFVYDHELYRVIGILDVVSESFYGDDNGCVFLPYVDGNSYQMVMKTNFEAKVKQYLSWCLNSFDVDYDVFSQTIVKEGMQVLLDLLESVLFIIASVSLVVSLVGIMNVCLLSVNGRVCEIGIRKTIGASDVSLFVQLILEVVMIGVVGYVMGSLLSIVLVGLLCWYLGCSFYMSIGLFGVLFVLCLLVSILSGLLPAILACKKNVVEVLHF